MFQRRVINEHDEEESIFISMTDLTVSMMLLLVILLGFFASQFRNASLFEQSELAAQEISALQSEIEDLERQLLATMQDTETLRDQLRLEETAHLEEANELRAQVQNLQNENLALQMEVDAVTEASFSIAIEFDRSVASLNQDIESLEARLSELNARRTAEIEELSARLAVEAENLAMALAANQQLRQQLDQNNVAINVDRQLFLAEIAQDRDQIQALQENIQALRRAEVTSAAEREGQVTALTQQIIELEGNLSEVEARRLRDLEILGAQLLALEAELASVRAAESALNDAFLAMSEARGAETLGLLEQLSMIQEQNLVLQLENAALTEAATAASSERDRAVSALEQRIAELEQSLAATQLEMVPVERLLSISTELEAAQSREQALEAELQNALNRELQASSLSSGLLADIDAFRIENTALDQQLQEKEEQVAMLRSQLQTLEALLASVMNTTTSLLGGAGSTTDEPTADRE